MINKRKNIMIFHIPVINYQIRRSYAQISRNQSLLTFVKKNKYKIKINNKNFKKNMSLGH